MQRLQLERVSLHDSKRGDYQHTKKVIEQLILLGEMDRAVQLLLETELENPNYYTDAIKYDLNHLQYFCHTVLY